MGWMEFVAMLVDALAWPAAVVALAVKFRKTIQEFADGRVKRLKAGPAGFEIEYWDHTAGAVKEAAKQLSQGVIRPELPPLVELEADPGGVVVTSFSKIEARLRDVVVGGGVSSDESARSMGSKQLVKLALEANLITSESAVAIEGLSVLRNLSAHGLANDLDAARAAEFATMTETVLYSIADRAQRRRT